MHACGLFAFGSALIRMLLMHTGQPGNAVSMLLLLLHPVPLQSATLLEPRGRYIGVYQASYQSGCATQRHARGMRHQQ